MKTAPKSHISWPRLFVLTFLAAYCYIFMEWLFFATKPSFMDVLTTWKKLEVLFLTAFVLSILLTLLLVILMLLEWISGPTRKWQIQRHLGVLLPALLAASTCLLLIDNFTYTLFKYGIVTSQGAARVLYALVMIALLVVWYIRFLRGVRVRNKPVEPGGALRQPLTTSQKIRLGAGIALLLLPVGLLVLRLVTSGQRKAQGEESGTRQPNIVLIGGEGVVSSQMSLYGYYRETTPNLDELAQTGLLAENNYTNASHTTGSIISMLTGKYPADTRLMYSPNILQGEDAYEHLPGILQRAGYTTIEITFPYYIDAYDLNMQDAFDLVNGRSLDEGKLFNLTRSLHLEDVGYFLPRLYERIANRLLHIFFIRQMPDPYGQVIQAVDPQTMPQLADRVRIQQAISQLVNSDTPVFLHVHLMGTHGGKFYPRRRVFSAGEEQVAEWMPDFYDDAVLDFDAYIGELVKALQRNNLLDDTLLIVYSDHSDQWKTDDRIPLLFRFPDGVYAGRLRNNTQNLDIAPTLLDYLGLEIPSWMSGRSLLAGEPPATRTIISAGVVGVDCDRPGWWCIVDTRLVEPPFYQFGYIQVVVCQKRYVLDLNTRNFYERNVPGHTAACSAEELPSSDEVRQVILDHLRLYGFDVSSLIK